MRSKKNMVNSLIYFLLLSVLISCEDKISYQRVKFDGKNKKIEILSNEFVFDSIIIENNNNIFFNAILTNRKAGVNIFYLSNNSEKNYKIFKNNYDEMCFDKNDNSMKNFSILIRSKNYFGTNQTSNPSQIQRFNISYLPCDNQTLILEARKHH